MDIYADQSCVPLISFLKWFPNGKEYGTMCHSVNRRLKLKVWNDNVFVYSSTCQYFFTLTSVANVSTLSDREDNSMVSKCLTNTLHTYDITMQKMYYKALNKDATN